MTNVIKKTFRIKISLGKILKVLNPFWYFSYQMKIGIRPHLNELLCFSLNFTHFNLLSFDSDQVRPNFLIAINSNYFPPNHFLNFINLININLYIYVYIKKKWSQIFYPRVWGNFRWFYMWSSSPGKSSANYVSSIALKTG